MSFAKQNLWVLLEASALIFFKFTTSVRIHFWPGWSQADCCCDVRSVLLKID